MQDFNVAAVGLKPILFILGVALVPAALAFVALHATHNRTFAVAWFVAGFSGLVALGLLAQLCAVRVSVEAGKLVVGGGMYSVAVERDAIRTKEVRRLSPEEVSQGLGQRTNGVGMPGLALGWFQRNGAKRVFALATNAPPILVPTTLDYDIVVSPIDSERFLATMEGL